MSFVRDILLNVKRDNRERHVFQNKFWKPEVTLFRKYLVLNEVLKVFSSHVISSHLAV